MSEGIVLIGLPGSGKTSVGRQVAELLERPFIDIDQEIEHTTGRHPAAILAEDGESRLRALERGAVAAAVTNRAAVIATGGGTIVDPLNRWLLMDHGMRVRLDAPVETLVARLRADTATPRPLLGGDLEAGLRRTAESRRAMYAAMDAAVAAIADVDAVAAAVVEETTRTRSDERRTLFDGTFARQHPLGPAMGRVVFGRGLGRDQLAADVAAAAPGMPAVVADKAAIDANPALDAAVASGRRCDLDGGEQTKTMTRLEQLLTWLNSINIERTEPLVVVGGGTLGDVAGLAAAMYRRGIPLVNVPTTWLAQADSSLGGKVAIDLPNAKNGVGAFWPAWLTLIDVEVPRSLPIARRRDGIAECLKAGLIGDAALWELVEQRGRSALDGTDPAAAYAITERAARVKLDIVDRDPYETGERRKLNLGHTLGHALEIESGYTLGHGAAVALGLRAVARIAKRRGAQADLAERIDTVLAELGFDLTRSFDRVAVIAATLTDKKRASGRQRWILPLAAGEVIEVDDVSDAELDDALDVIAAPRT